MFAMVRRALGLVCGVGVVFAGLAGCGGEGAASSAAAPSIDPAVRTSFYPATYFAERIAGGLVPVESPLPEGEDPIFWTPDAETIGLYQRAKLIVLNGAEFEKWAASAALPRSRVVEMAAALDEPLITIKGTTHSHGPAGEHSHDGVDGHTWVDPLNAAEQAAMLAERMAEAWPEHAVAMRKNAAGLEADLRALHARLQEIDVSGVTLLASHPAYNYLARRLGWVVTGFDLDPQAAIDGETSSDLMAKLVEVDAGDRPVVMLWESSPTDAAITRLRQMGIASVLFNPAETAGSSDGDYLAVMSANIDRLADAVR